MVLIKKHVLLFVLLCVPLLGHAQPGNVIKVETFKDLDVTTNTLPWGNHPYHDTFTFPSASKSFYKVVAVFRIACHSSYDRCGEWDYGDGIFIVRERPGGDMAEALRQVTEDQSPKLAQCVEYAVQARQNPDPDMECIELIRYITPFGNWFSDSKGFYFEWKIDVTDYVGFLRDDIVLMYNHSGWESATTRGWNITLTFHMTEGTPIREWLSMDYIPWRGGTYGDPANPIASRLPGYSFTPAAGTVYTRLKINQTGHGINRLTQCAEFCPRHRTLKLDGQIFDRRLIWKNCGYNPLYPQGGTWIYNRSNWCPGEPSWPYEYDLKVTPGTSYTLTMEMEAEGGGSPGDHGWSSYSIHAWLIQYGDIAFSHDASIEEIISPSAERRHWRYNPTCGEPIIVIRNNGKNTLTSARISYGLENGASLSHDWSGSLGFMQKDTIRLSGILNWENINKATFVATISSPNGQNDEYAHNNQLQSEYIPAPTYQLSGTSTVPVKIETNSSSSVENWFQLYNVTTEKVVHENRRLENNSTILENIPVMPGHCYRFLISDEGRRAELEPNLVSVPRSIPNGYSGDGLSFWNHSQEGKGQVSIVDMNLYPDFGNRAVRYFTTSTFELGLDDEDNKGAEALLVPNPVDQNQVVSIIAKLPMARLQVLSLSGALKFSETFVQSVREFNFSTSGLPKGFYIVRVDLKNGKEITRKLILQ